MRKALSFNNLSFTQILLMGWLIISQQFACADPLVIDINQGQVAPTPIALVPLTGQAAQINNMGRQIIDVIASDLERSGLFRPIDPQAFIQDTQSLR